MAMTTSPGLRILPRDGPQLRFIHVHLQAQEQRRLVRDGLALTKVGQGRPRVRVLWPNEHGQAFFQVAVPHRRQADVHDVDTRHGQQRTVEFQRHRLNVRNVAYARPPMAL